MKKLNKRKRPRFWCASVLLRKDEECRHFPLFAKGISEDHLTESLTQQTDKYYKENELNAEEWKLTVEIGEVKFEN